MVQVKITNQYYPLSLKMAFNTVSYSIRKKIITIFFTARKFLQKNQRADVKSRQTAGAGGEVLF